MSLHAVLIAGVVPAGHSLSGRAPFPAMTVRMVSAEEARGVQPPADASNRAPARPADRPVDRPATPDVAGAAPAPSPARAGRAAAASDATRSTAAPAEPAYQTGGRMDPGPRPLEDIVPTYPAEAGMQVGRVVLRLRIDERGVVRETRVLWSSPPGLFDAAAVQAFSAAPFAPGLVAGVPVRSQIDIEVEFTPYNRGSAVSGKSY